MLGRGRSIPGPSGQAASAPLLRLPCRLPSRRVPRPSRRPAHRQPECQFGVSCLFFLLRRKRRRRRFAGVDGRSTYVQRALTLRSTASGPSRSPILRRVSETTSRTGLQRHGGKLHRPSREQARTRPGRQASRAPSSQTRGSASCPGTSDVELASRRG